MPDNDFLTFLVQSNVRNPWVTHQQDLCAALTWARAFLQTSRPVSDWDNLPEEMRETLLELYPLPPPRSHGPSLSDMQRLAAAINMYTPDEFRPPPIDLDSQPSPPLSATVAPALPGAPINTVRQPTTSTSGCPAPSHGAAATWLPQPWPWQPTAVQPPQQQAPWLAPMQHQSQWVPQPPQPAPPAQPQSSPQAQQQHQQQHYQAQTLSSSSAASSSLKRKSEFMSYDEMHATAPEAVFRCLDLVPAADPDKKNKTLENLRVKGLAAYNLQFNAPLSHMLVLQHDKRAPWNSIDRGLTLAMAARSVQVDPLGSVDSGDEDIATATDDHFRTKFKEEFDKMSFNTYHELSQSQVSLIWKCVKRVFKQKVGRAKLYNVDEILKAFQRQSAELATYSTQATDAILRSVAVLPAADRGRACNKEYYTFFYPFIAEHIMGRDAIDKTALVAEVNRVFAALPMTAVAPALPLAPPWTPPPAYIPPSAALPMPLAAPTPSPSHAIAPPGPHFVPPVPAFAAAAPTSRPPAKQRTPGTPRAPATASTPGLGAFLGKPCSPVVVGNDIGILLPPFHRHCQCAVWTAFPHTRHRTWECPLAYVARFGSCPGYATTGARIPSAWNAANDSLLPATRAAWKTFIATHGLATAQHAPGDVAF